MWRRFLDLSLDECNTDRAQEIVDCVVPIADFCAQVRSDSDLACTQNTSSASVVLTDRLHTKRLRICTTKTGQSISGFLIGIADISVVKSSVVGLHSTWLAMFDAASSFSSLRPREFMCPLSRAVPAETRVDSG